MARKIRRKTTSNSKSIASTSKRRGKRTDDSKAAAVHRGTSGFALGNEKRKKQDDDYERRKLKPWPFRLDPGSSAKVVVLDKGEPFFISLHKVKNNKGYWDDEVCIADTGQTCPLCTHLGKDGSYTMLLTVLDRRPYKVQKGPNAGKVIKVSKKLFMVKGKNLPKFQRQYEKRGEDLRGLHIECRRDGDKEAAIGEDLDFLGVVKDSALRKYKDIAMPAPYPEIFPIPTAKELIDRYNIDGAGGGSVGSGEFDDEDDKYDMDDVAW